MGDWWGFCWVMRGSVRVGPVVVEFDEGAEGIKGVLGGSVGVGDAGGECTVAGAGKGVQEPFGNLAGRVEEVLDGGWGCRSGFPQELCK